MKSTMRIAVLAGACVLFLTTICAAANDKPKPHTLPIDGKTPVIVYDSVGGMLMRSHPDPVLQILADGTLLAGDPWGRGRKVKGKLTADELQSLLHFILDEQKFNDIKLEDLRLKKSIIMDAPTTHVTVDADGEKMTAFGVSPATVAAEAGPNSPASRFLTITRRLEQLTEITKLGGPDALQKSLEAANAAIKKEHPEEPQVDASDLTRADAQPDGGAVAFFDHKVATPNGKWHRLDVTVTHPAKGAIKVKVEKGYEQG